MTKTLCLLIFFLGSIILLISGVESASAAEAKNTLPPLITPKAALATKNGLAYLAHTQNKGGSWRSNGYQGGYPCVMTSLAGLAFLAGGNTPIEGKYARNVRRATVFLLRNATGNGVIASLQEESRSMYGHGFAMLFLAQVYGMEPDPIRQKKIRRVLERAIRLTAKSQSKDGGWMYNPSQNADEGSVTVTQIQGLRACRNAGIKVPKSTIDRACKYIEKCANKDGGIAYSLRSHGSSRPAITAAAVAVMYNAGQYENKVAKGALKFTLNKLKQNKGDPWRAFGGHAYYSLLYASQAMWLSSEKNWNNFFPKVRNKLVKMQAKNGSWQSRSTGKVFGTAIALLVLQLPNQYLPVLQR